MSKIWYCANCGYEVGTRGRCHLCRGRLTASALPELEPADGDDEVGYRLGDWADIDRGRLIVELNVAEVLHRFEDDELVVAAEDEERVDDLIAEVSAGVADDTAVGGGDVDSPRTGAGPVDDAVHDGVVLLADAAGRLRRDPTDMLADADVAQASTSVFMVDEYGDIDPDSWAAIGRVTRRLLGALGSDDALEDEIRSQAGILARLLAPVVAAGERSEPPATPEDGGEVDASTSTEVPSTASTDVGDGEETAPGEASDDEFAEGEEFEHGEEFEDGDSEEGDSEDEDSDDVVYELSGWLPEQRAQLDLLLEDAGIASEWDGDDLIVPAESESVVEGLFDQVGRVDEGDDEEDEARYHALEELFAAAGRLASEPDDEDRISELLTWIDTVNGPTPVGLDEAVWLRITNRAHSLAGSLDSGADDRIVSAEAADLRDLLRAVV